MNNQEGVDKSEDRCREDRSREYAKGFIVQLSTDMRVILREKRDAGLSHSDEDVQAMMKMLYGLHVIIEEQEFGKLMLDLVGGDA